MTDASKQNCPVVLQTGFRIFFLGAAAHAVVAMSVWLRCYATGKIMFVAMPLTVWHGHEMVFGFTMAACDLLFLIFLAVAVTRPVVAARQWRRSAVLSKLILIVLRAGREEQIQKGMHGSSVF